MIDEVFFDSLISISITGEVIRLDFGTYDAEAEAPAQGEEPPMVLRQRVVMPLNGFAQAFGIQEQVMKKLLDGGIIKRVNPVDFKASSPAPQASGSPNFKPGNQPEGKGYSR